MNPRPVERLKVRSLAPPSVNVSLSKTQTVPDELACMVNSAVGVYIKWFWWGLIDGFVLKLILHTAKLL